MSKKENLTLKGYYESLQKQPRKVIQQIAEECGVIERTVENWIYGTYIPKLADKQIISKITGIAIENLFPEKEETC